MGAMWGKWTAKVRTPRGLLVTTLSALVALSSLASGIEEGGTPVVTMLLGTLIGFAVLWLVLWGVVSFVASVWEERTRPTSPAFARREIGVSSRTMLREDTNAHFFEDRLGFMFRRRIWFVGTGCPPVEIHRERYEYVRTRSGDAPVAVAARGGRKWWTFRSRFFWENEGYESSDIKALVLQRDREKERRLRHAHALMRAPDVDASKREGIPRAVKDEVWKKYAGKCAECGRAYMLEYDHIIPLSMGGSSTASNLQLLCADCNRSKGGRL